MSRLLLRQLAYLGSAGKAASVAFESGLNVICGASETGKSFIGESIDFMLGQEGPMRMLPEGVEFPRVRLVIENVGETSLTLDRSIEGNDYRVLDEMVLDGRSSTKGRILRWKHSASRSDTLSNELLKRVGYAGCILRRNASGKTRTVSFRDLARLCVVSEDEIQRRGSPILSGQFVNATSEYAAFKLLLTGIDDSSLVSMGANSSPTPRDEGKIELLAQMISEIEIDLDKAGIKEDELLDRQSKLELSLKTKSEFLESAELELSQLMERRSESANKLNEAKSRMVEISGLKTRFVLLDRHYLTDLARLQAIRESGSLFIHLPVEKCPLCGAAPQEQHRDAECDESTELVVGAANAEIEKIHQLRRELGETRGLLEAEYTLLSSEVSERTKIVEEIESVLNKGLVPNIQKERITYDSYMRELSNIQSSLEKIKHLKQLNDRREKMQEGYDASSGQSRESRTHIQKSILDEFSQEVQRILEDWNYPDAGRVFFDESKRDLQISGKERGSAGKGLRAITHAAFTLGLMQFCLERNLPHPGFIVLDSPLLAYWKPEGDDDDLRGTDLKERFYRYLLGITSNAQVVIIENEHPPEFVIREAPVTIFTRNPSVGRYGFFPMKKA